MSKFSWEEFKNLKTLGEYKSMEKLRQFKDSDWVAFEEDNIYVYCDTKEKAKDFIKNCYKRGLEWSKWGNGLNINTTFFNDSVGGIYYTYNKKINTILWSEIHNNDMVIVLKYDMDIPETETVNTYGCDKTCLHYAVCGEKENWKQYCIDHIRLRKELVLFDKEPVCPCRIEETKYIELKFYDKELEIYDKQIEQKKRQLKRLQDYLDNPENKRSNIFY